jgi:hypothetical protein
LEPKHVRGRARSRSMATGTRDRHDIATPGVTRWIASANSTFGAPHSGSRPTAWRGPCDLSTLVHCVIADRERDLLRCAVSQLLAQMGRPRKLSTARALFFDYLTGRPATSSKTSVWLPIWPPAKAAAAPIRSAKKLASIPAATAFRAVSTSCCLPEPRWPVVPCSVSVVRSFSRAMDAAVGPSSWPAMLAVVLAANVPAPTTIKVATAHAARPCAAPVPGAVIAPAIHPPRKAAMIPEIAQYPKAPQLTPTCVVAAVDVSRLIKPMPRPSIVSST